MNTDNTLKIKEIQKELEKLTKEVYNLIESESTHTYTTSYEIAKLSNLHTSLALAARDCADLRLPF